jgi:hypothetical protein
VNVIWPAVKQDDRCLVGSAVLGVGDVQWACVDLLIGTECVVPVGCAGPVFGLDVRAATVAPAAADSPFG